MKFIWKQDTEKCRKRSLCFYTENFLSSIKASKTVSHCKLVYLSQLNPLRLEGLRVKI